MSAGGGRIVQTFCENKQNWSSVEVGGVDQTFCKCRMECSNILQEQRGLIKILQEHVGLMKLSGGVVEIGCTFCGNGQNSFGSGCDSGKPNGSRSSFGAKMSPV